jgi:hypothetical protein
MGLWNSVLIAAFAFLYYAIPIGLGAVVLAFVLRRHRRQMADDSRMQREKRNGSANS